jgi:hypothetical protein
MPTSSTAAETVVLKGGLTVSLDALRLLWGFEDRGCIVRTLDGSTLQVGPRHLISDEERERIRQYKPELLALVNYCDVQ